MNTFTSKRRTLLAAALLACTLGQPAFAAEINGVKFADTAQVAGRELKLNGLGMRTKLFVKVYAAGLYLPEKKREVAEVLKLDGPRRVTLVMMRDVSSEDFGKAYMDGLDANLEPAEKARLASHIAKVGDMFGRMEGLKKGDVVTLDWVPGTGSVYEVNGKRISAPIPDLDYYNAMLRIWLGNKPVDGSLKTQLLGK
jgi:hypothetical protein